MASFMEFDSDFVPLNIAGKEEKRAAIDAEWARRAEWRRSSKKLTYLQKTAMQFDKTYRMMSELVDFMQQRELLLNDFKFLDIGCAPGGISQFLLEMPNCHRGYGISLHPKKGGFRMSVDPSLNYGKSRAQMVFEQTDGVLNNSSSNSSSSAWGSSGLANSANNIYSNGNGESQEEQQPRFSLCWFDLLEDPDKFHVPYVGEAYNLAICDAQVLDKEFGTKTNGNAKRGITAAGVPVAKTALFAKQLILALHNLAEDGVLIMRHFAWEEVQPNVLRMWYFLLDMFNGEPVTFKSKNSHMCDLTCYVIFSGFRRTECLQRGLLHLLGKDYRKFYRLNTNSELMQLRKDLAALHEARLDGQAIPGEPESVKQANDDEIGDDSTVAEESDGVKAAGQMYAILRSASCPQLSFAFFGDNEDTDTRQFSKTTQSSFGRSRDDEFPESTVSDEEVEEVEEMDELVEGQVADEWVDEEQEAPGSPAASEEAEEAEAGQTACTPSTNTAGSTPRSLPVADVENMGKDVLVDTDLLNNDKNNATKITPNGNASNVLGFGSDITTAWNSRNLEVKSTGSNQQSQGCIQQQTEQTQNIKMVLPESTGSPDLAPTKLSFSPKNGKKMSWAEITEQDETLQNCSFALPDFAVPLQYSPKSNTAEPRMKFPLMEKSDAAILELQEMQSSSLLPPLDSEGFPENFNEKMNSMRLPRQPTDSTMCNGGEGSPRTLPSSAGSREFDAQNMVDVVDLCTELEITEEHFWQIANDLAIVNPDNSMSPDSTNQTHMDQNANNMNMMSINNNGNQFVQPFDHNVNVDGVDTNEHAQEYSVGCPHSASHCGTVYLDDQNVIIRDDVSEENTFIDVVQPIFPEHMAPARPIGEDLWDTCFLLENSSITGAFSLPPGVMNCQVMPVHVPQHVPQCMPGMASMSGMPPQTFFPMAPSFNQQGRQQGMQQGFAPSPMDMMTNCPTADCPAASPADNNTIDVASMDQTEENCEEAEEGGEKGTGKYIPVAAHQRLEENDDPLQYSPSQTGLLMQIPARGNQMEFSQNGLIQPECPGLNAPCDMNMNMNMNADNNTNKMDGMAIPPQGNMAMPINMFQMPQLPVIKEQDKKYESSWMSYNCRYGSPSRKYGGMQEPQIFGQIYPNVLRESEKFTKVQNLFEGVFDEAARNAAAYQQWSGF